jgi:hypothetical protein
MHSALLMTRQNMTNFATVEGIIEWQNRSARMAKDRVHPFPQQTLYENIRAFHGSTSLCNIAPPGRT